jgi:hypothetical protein
MAGVLPSGEALSGLTALTSLDIREHAITGWSGGGGRVAVLRPLGSADSHRPEHPPWCQQQPFVHTAVRPPPPPLSPLPACLTTHTHTGTLPEDWSSLTLEAIRLDRNQLEGPLPPAWFSAGRPLSGSLRVLTLWANKLSGPLPDTADGGMQVRQLLV